MYRIYADTDGHVSVSMMKALMYFFNESFHGAKGAFIYVQ